jgi:GT2 family glycosyltransferase
VTPRIRVVVVDHDGGDMTLACLDRLQEVGAPAGTDVELVLVDNGSTVSVAGEVERRWPSVVVRRSTVNTGFAGGNNIALRDLDGIDFVALVNNDVLVEHGWLEPLLIALRGEPELGAAGPKLLFAGRYRELELQTEGHVLGGGDPRVVGVRWFGVADEGGEAMTAQLVRGFFGPQRDMQRGWFEWTAPSAAVHVEADERSSLTCRLRLGADGMTPVAVRSDGHDETLRVDRGAQWYDVQLRGDPFDVINNAGTTMLDNWYGADRGFLERDAGQYDEPQDVLSWCGGAVLLRADYLRDTGIFDERLFLYYEDLELSLRGAARGWRYRYEPRSVVRHRVGATAIHGSASTERFKERNRLLVLVRHFPLSVAVRAAVRYLLSTASYARRDVVAPLLRGQRPDGEVVANRLRAFRGFMVLAPSMWRSRRFRSGTR